MRGVSRAFPRKTAQAPYVFSLSSPVRSPLLQAEPRQLHAQVDPAPDELPQPPVVSQLLPDRRQILSANELASALPLPCEAELVVGAVLARRGRLATASRLATDVVLPGEVARTHLAQAGDLLLDLEDLRLQGSHPCYVSRPVTESVPG